MTTLREKPTYTTLELAEYFDLSMRRVQALCRTGRIAAVKIGKEFRIPHSEFERVKRDGATYR